MWHVIPDFRQVGQKHNGGEPRKCEYISYDPLAGRAGKVG